MNFLGRIRKKNGPASRSAKKRLAHRPLPGWWRSSPRQASWPRRLLGWRTKLGNGPSVATARPMKLRLAGGFVYGTNSSKSTNLRQQPSSSRRISRAGAASPAHPHGHFQRRSGRSPALPYPPWKWLQSSTAGVPSQTAGPGDLPLKAPPQLLLSVHGLALPEAARGAPLPPFDPRAHALSSHRQWCIGFIAFPDHADEGVSWDLAAVTGRCRTRPRPRQGSALSSTPGAGCGPSE